MVDIDRRALLAGAAAAVIAPPDALVPNVALAEADFGYLQRLALSAPGPDLLLCSQSFFDLFIRSLEKLEPNRAFELRWNMRLAHG